jgi:adenosylhomocysteine nucleosidase
LPVNSGDNPLASTVAIVVGLVAEARLARPLGLRVAIGGGTAAGADSAAARLVRDGATALVSFGLAGGLDPALRPGAILVPRAIIVDGRMIATDPALSAALGGPTPHTILGGDAIAADADTKRVLREATGADAIDLESGAVARLADAHGLPCAAIRVICDPAERSLPPAALVALNSGGVIGLGRVLAALAARPGQLPALLALAADAARARRALAAYVTTRRLARGLIASR